MNEMVAHVTPSFRARGQAEQKGSHKGKWEAVYQVEWRRVAEARGAQWQHLLPIPPPFPLLPSRGTRNEGPRIILSKTLAQGAPESQTTQGQLGSLRRPTEAQGDPETKMDGHDYGGRIPGWENLFMPRNVGEGGGRGANVAKTVGALVLLLSCDTTGPPSPLPSPLVVGQ